MEIVWNANDEIGAVCMAALRAGLPQEELEVYMAEVAYGMLDKFAYQPLPSTPHKLESLRADMDTMDWKTQKKEAKQEILLRVFKDPEVSKYMDAVGKITSSNYSNAKALEEYMSIWLEWEEADKATKCWELYREYPDAIRLYENGGIIWQKKRKGFGERQK